MGNLWEDDAKWLKLSDPGVTQILAIAVDPLTENIFYIIPERGIPISEIINNSSDDIDMGNRGTLKRPDLVNTIGISVLATLERLYQNGLSYGPLREENIFLCQSQVLHCEGLPGHSSGGPGHIGHGGDGRDVRDG